MSVGWGIDVPGLMTRHEVAELCVARGWVGVLLSDETVSVAETDDGLVLFEPAAVVGDETLYRATVTVAS